MIAGGIELSHCTVSRVYAMFEAFKFLDEQLREFQQGKQLVVKLGNKELRLSSNGQKGRHQLESYSRTAMDNGRWVTVQIRRWNGFIGKTAVEIFNDNGKSIASVTDWSCDTGDLAISKQAKQEGQDTIIQSALLAVTGKKYEVVVADE